MTTNDILCTLQDIDSGAAVDHANRELSKLVQAVVAAEKKGSLMIRLDVLPRSEGAVGVQCEIKTAYPSSSTQITPMYPDEDGYLSPRDPRQAALPGVDE